MCGSFLVIGDTQSRVDAHLLGKQHIGFARIRTAIDELKVHDCSNCKYGKVNTTLYVIQ